MMDQTGPILRLFEVQTKPGCAAKLLDSFATTSAAVVMGRPGNQGYFFGREIEAEGDKVMFVSVWANLDAIKAHFGETWQQSFLPPGYEEMIAHCSIRHVDLSGGWHVDGALTSREA
ncbi:antibiotic biosynthesis monooxygenase family protein [Roseibium sp.]|uniref:antibiotic biosynthesis monooxygenase family protein n=1 Tax=Roseibium sp. TaxID=1936156 RepID=UPI003BB10ADF